jgi:hypothetical protein
MIKTLFFLTSISLCTASLFSQNTSIDPCDAVLNFDGINDYVSVPYAAELNTPTFSLAFWTKVTGNAGAYQSPLTNRGVSKGNLYGYAVYADPSNKWSVLIGNGGDTWYGLGGNDDVVLDKWTYVALTHNGTTGKLYIDGKLTDSVDFVYAPNLTQELRIGAGVTESPNPEFFFKGQVDKMLLWEKTLADTTIMNLMKADWKKIDWSGLVAGWDFNETQQYSPVLTDFTISANDGTLVNMDPQTDWTLADGGPLSAWCYVITSLASDKAGKDLFEVYPNPHKGQLTLHSAGNKEDFTVVVYNVLGHEVFRKAYVATEETQLSYEGEAGMYYMEVMSSTGKTSKQKLVRE